ncbi:protein of unknown function [Magnetospirillum sp. XM-1]|nr:protein of unknown function [Magnetospirillum sp. XM-1]
MAIQQIWCIQLCQRAVNRAFLISSRIFHMVSSF